MTRNQLAHTCHACGKHWALRLVDHPAGKVVVCRYCRTVRASSPARRPITAAL